MNGDTQTATYLAAIWGVVYALFLQTKFGMWLCHRRTWITVVAGVGVDFAIGFYFVPDGPLFEFFRIVAASAAGIIVRSIINERLEHRELERIHVEDNSRQRREGS